MFLCILLEIHMILEHTMKPARLLIHDISDTNRLQHNFLSINLKVISVYKAQLVLLIELKVDITLTDVNSVGSQLSNNQSACIIDQLLMAFINL